MMNFNFESMESMLLIGLIIVVVEVFFLPGLGFLFLAFGIFSTTGIIYFFPGTIEYIYALIGMLSIIWCAVLWKPLKYCRSKEKSDKVIDIIGSKVEVVETDLMPGIMGRVLWSGTIMNAMLRDEVSEKILIGSACIVTEIKGNILIVKPI